VVKDAEDAQVFLEEQKGQDRADEITDGVEAFIAVW